MDFYLKFSCFDEFYLYYKDSVVFETLKMQSLHHTTTPSFCCLKKSFQTFLLCKPPFPPMILTKIVEEYLPPHACMLQLGFGYSKFYKEAIVKCYLKRSYEFNKVLDFKNDDMILPANPFRAPALKISMIPTYPQTKEGWCQLDCLNGDFVCCPEVYRQLILRYGHEEEEGKVRKIGYKGGIIQLYDHPFLRYCKVMWFTTIELMNVISDSEEPTCYLALASYK